MASKIAYVDCSSGISGAMFLGALLHAIPSSETLLDPIYELPIDDYEISMGTFDDKGIRGERFQARSTRRKQPEHRLADISTMLQVSRLSAYVQEISLAIFSCLAKAEANVQGVRVDDVQFYDKGAVDTIITVIGVALGMEALGITQLYTSPLPLTSGHVKTPRGLLPIPAPITLEILRHVNAPWKSCEVEEELVTPTGAAILATLARFETPAIAIERVGYGFGQKRLPWPHCLRLCLGQAREVAGSSSEDADTDWVVVIESHIDTMSGELFGGLMERLLAEGALDVSYTPLQMKKNRPATLVTVITRPEDGDRLAMLLLRETSTLGVRIQEVQRLKAQRAQEQISTPLGPMIVKVKRLGTRIISVAPEYEECQRIAREQNIPLAEVYEVAREAARSLII